ncbi:hypothetical protein J4E93_001220 [Alternaria ventricosa]|uniref:uncharacterized protein n=1 Tax=Alternaria ventricosa TaxID=1187951 RepID=UPI0020C240F0|nr:uncharacterized protein J4E93_001220 [Alternaria ventricosa]KAI4653454.1 hypothetical protein J4E93_001220 [Alternaria ventricosa]
MTEMYYALDYPGVYLKTNFAESKVRMAVLQENSADTGEAPLYAVWDSLWGLSDTMARATKDMSGKEGLRVHSVLVIEEELWEGVTILSQPPGKNERRLHVYPMNDFYRSVLNHTAKNDAMQNPALRYKPMPRQLVAPKNKAQEENVDDEELVGSSGVQGHGYTTRKAKGKGKQKQATTDEDMDTSSEDEEDQPLYLCVRRQGTSPYYLIAEDDNLFLVRCEHAGDWERMLKEGPKGNLESFTFDSASRVELSSFPKGFSIRLIDCGMISKKKPANAPVGTTNRDSVDDNTFHLLHPETNRLKHREYYYSYNRHGNSVEEAKMYPKWDDRIAKYNESVLDEFLNALQDLVLDAAGSWTDNRP